MRILAISELYPWPAVDGYRQRLTHMISGLTQVGTVDLMCLARPGHPHDEEPPIDGLGRVVAVEAGEPVPARQWMPLWSRTGTPRRILSLDWSAAREELMSWNPRPDLVWFSHVDSWYPLHDLLDGTPAIVDFDNLENLAMKLYRRVPPRFAPGSAAQEKAKVAGRWGMSRALDLVDEQRWTSIQRRCAEQVDKVVVCSPLDAERAGADNAVTIPNGAAPPVSVHSNRIKLRGDSPTLMFVGALDYGPNTEAIEWFVREVWPHILERQPETVFRIVGRGSESVAWVGGEPGVELVGAVDDIQVELDRADVSIVPIRVGAGTRLKVVEAMANHIPLVTTSVGCEGIDVEGGVHCLIADGSRTFADACLRMLGDPLLRQELADSASQLYEQSYMWESIERRVANLAVSVIR